MKHLLLIIFLVILATSAFAQTEQTMYWIGGAGSWSDLSHWSYQSGTQNPSNQPSSVPTATTNVIIDGNSGLTGTGSVSARRITVNISPVIKSLTFTAGSNACLYNSGTQILRVTGDITLQANTTIYYNSGFYIAMEPETGNTSSLTTNGHPLTFYFGKNGSGTTNIVGDNISTINLRVYGGTLNFNGTNWSSATMYVANDGTVMNMPNISTYTNNGTSYIGGTAGNYNTSVSTATLSNAQLNLPQVTDFTNRGDLFIMSSYGLTLPLCTTFSTGTSTLNIYNPSFLSMPVCTTISAYSFTLSSTIAHSFPALKALTLSGLMQVGNVNASLALGTDGTLVTCQAWTFGGTLLNADKSEFHITYPGTSVGESANTNAHFLAKDGTQINKIIFENANAEAYLSSTGTYSQGITIDSLTFVKRGASIAQSMTIGTLSVAPSMAYTIATGRTITLTNDLVDTTPDCETFWQLTGGTSASNVATINNSTGHSIALENAQVTRITGTGANDISATGIDNGGNTGITFTAPAPKTVYWVGHAGDDQWHTLQNWAQTSGGNDYCMPTQYDDIVFDQNSVITGTAITLTSVSAYFHDITIRDDCPKTAFSILPSPNTNPTGPGLYCYGSWYMKPGVSVRPEVYFMSGDMGETITSNTSTFSDVYFTNVGGWVLADDLKTVYHSTYQQGSLSHRIGTLNTNGHKVDIASSFFGNGSGTTYLPAGSTATAYRKLVLGSSEITIRGRYSSNACAWYFGYAVTDTLDAGTSTIIFDPYSSYSTLTAYSSITSSSTSTTGSNSTLNPSAAARNNALGTLRYYNIVFKGAGPNTITNSGYTSSLTQFEANSVRSEVKSSLTFDVKWVKLDSLYAAPFSTVYLPAPTTNSISSVLSTSQLTINESMEIPTPDCTGFSTLAPNNSTYPATISSAVDIDIPNVQMTRVKSTGGGNFTASGIDNGGNDGWIFTERLGRDLYWIGAAGDGLWNTPANWTSNADGTPDGGCVPAKADNVHFNQYSVIPSNKTIRIDTNDANFNNFIAEPGTPSGIIIYQYSVQINSYGNLFHTGENMKFTSNSTSSTSYVVNLLSPATDAQLVNATGSSFYQLVVNNAAARWTFKDNMTMDNTLTITAVTELTFDMDKLSGYQIVHNAGIVNMADSLITKATSSFFSYTMNGSCTLNADNTVWNISGFSSTSGTRTLNIRNAQIIILTTAGSSNYSNWYYYGTGATLNAGGSYIQLYYNFTGLNGQRYGTVETIRGREPAYMNTITGDLYFEKMILNHDRRLVGNNTIDTLLLRPKGITLYLENGTTQTVNDLIQVSGSPCLQNTLRAGTPATESGATQNSATASINYLNSAGVNEWDQVKVGGILATGDSLKFAGNSSNYGLNNNKVVFYGQPGLVGLPDNTTCAPIDTIANPQAYILSAKEFYGTDLSTYKWYRRNANGTYPATPLAVPSTAMEIDTRDFGLDGTYKVEIVYDSTATTACRSVDETTITYQAPSITFDNGTSTDITWSYCETSTFRVRDLLTKLDSVSNAYTNTALFDTIRVYDAATGGNLLRDTLTLTNSGNYYLEFATSNVCTSAIRSHIGIEISDMPTANAGPNQSGNPLNPFTMAATATGGTGEWTLVSGEATIANPASATTTVQLINDSKQAVLRWTVTNGACDTFDLVTIGKSSVVPRANPSMRVRVQ